MAKTVYVTTVAEGTNGGDVVHTDEECQILERVNSYTEKDASVYPDRPVCDYCQDNTGQPETSNFEALNAARAADPEGL